MTYTPTIYDWPGTVVPVNQVFRAGGLSIMGGMTLGGASVENPEPGGRGELVLEIAPIANADANLAASWLSSRMLNGAVLRIPLFQPTVQIVADSVLGGSTSAGVLWSNGFGWAGNVPWRFDPAASVTAVAAKGASSFVVNLTSLGQVLAIGHVIGFHTAGYDFAHIVTDIAYDATNQATVSINPPLRRALAVSDPMKFRPIMLATCTNARDAMTNFRFGTSMTFNPLRLVEALV